jgi:aspartokinase-like uncharacterized kinase
MAGSVTVDVVIKLGGGIAAHLAHFDAVLDAVARGARAQRLLIVPGGGVFADAVRDADRRLGLSDDAAHWMAILGMNQFAHVLAERLRGGALLEDRSEIDAALDAGAIPVLAPYRWMREADPLPHSWDVTSDSIAAWVAGVVGARQLVLVKPPGAEGGVVDPCFARALPAGVTPTIVPADRLARLEVALGAPARGPG